MDNDCELLPPKAFDFFENVTDYDPNKSPSNGFEYLYQVITQASKQPQTKISNICTERFKKNQTIFIKEQENKDPRNDFIPSKEWQEEQLKNFEKVRHEINCKKLIWNKQDLDVKKNFLPLTVSSEDSWFTFCMESPPLLRNVLSISEPDVVRLLNYFVQWLEEEKIDFCQRINMWIYSLFVCLEEPLDPDICSDLRSIIRFAKNKRSTLKTIQDELLIPLNILICIPAIFFKQTDLCD